MGHDDEIFHVTDYNLFTLLICSMLVHIYMRILLMYYCFVFYSLFRLNSRYLYIHIHRIGARLLFMLISDDVTQNLLEYSFWIIEPVYKYNTKMCLLRSAYLYENQLFFVYKI